MADQYFNSTAMIHTICKISGFKHEGVGREFSQCSKLKKKKKRKETQKIVK